MVSEVRADRTVLEARHGADDLVAAALALMSEHDLEKLLRTVVSEARIVTGARRAALALHDDRGLWRLVHEGLSGAQAAAVASRSDRSGLLDAIASAPGPAQVEDVTSEPVEDCFAVGGPPTRERLGAPVVTRSHRGDLCVCDRTDGAPFDDADEANVGALARMAGAAIDTALTIRAERERARTRAAAAEARADRHVHRAVLGRVIGAQEAERARVARDLHDEIGQALTSVLLGLRLAEESIEGPAGVVALQRLHEVRDLVTAALDRVRSVAFELRPTVLDDVGLEPALERLVGGLASRCGVRLALDVDVGHTRLPADVETVLYRIVQEALTNVVRHAGATEASVQIVAGTQRVRAVIEDDGRGFEPREQEHSPGVAGMRERASLAGGVLRIESTPGRGTTVMAEVPRG